MLGILVFALRSGLMISMFFVIPWWEVVSIWSVYLITKWVFYRFVLGVNMLSGVSSALMQKAGMNTSVIVGSCILERCPLSVLESTFKRLVSLPGTQHFRKRVVRILGNDYFMDEREFKVGEHIRQLECGQVRDIDHLVEIMGREMMVPIDPSLSPWEVVHLPYFMGDKSAFFWKVNHALGDGVALQYLFSHSGDSPPQLMQRFAPRNYLFLFSWLFFPFFIIAGFIHNNTRSKDPSPLTNYPNNPLTGNRHTAYAGPYKLSQVKGVARRFGTTINIFLLSNMLTSMKQYFSEEHASQLTHMNIGIPVNYRWTPTPKHHLVLNNKFIIFIQNYPLSQITDIELQSLAVYHQLLTIIKKIINPFKLRMFEFMNYLNDMLPHRICKFFCEDYNDRSGLVFTNIAGSRTPISFSGYKVFDILYLAPSMGNAGANISIASYADRISVLANSDVSRLRNPKRYVEIFKRNLAKYLDKYEGGVEYAFPDLQDWNEK